MDDESIREQARKKLEGYKGLLGSLTHEQLRAAYEAEIAYEGTVYCGRVEDAPKVK
jgi:hypothetical protein